MGQRSQIYVRINKPNGDKKIFARYYSWNFGTRMISRARYTIEWLLESYFSSYLLEDDEFAKKLSRIMDTNFDYKDVVFGSDIVKDYQEEGIDDVNFNEYAFTGQDNNDGQLYLDLICKYDKEGHRVAKIKVKYAFVDYDLERLLSANEYMQWNTFYSYDSEVKWEDKISNCSSSYLEDEISFTKDNISYIDETASLMTGDELESFINYNYNYNIKSIKDLTAFRTQNGELITLSMYDMMNISSKYEHLLLKEYVLENYKIPETEDVDALIHDICELKNDYCGEQDRESENLAIVKILEERR